MRYQSAVGKKEVKAILFDNDGVLVDTERLYYRANFEMFEDAGFELTPQIYEEFYLRRNIGAWHLAQQAGVAEELFHGMREARNRRYSELLQNEQILIPGVLEAVKAAAERVTVGVVTSSRRDHFEIIHRRTGLLPLFNFIVAEGDYAKSKPDPEPYLVGVQRSGAAKSECVAIEDTERGLTAAAAAGLRCWVIPSELTRGQDFSAADAVLNSIEELLQRI